jgi:hypothetical protein
MVAPEADTSVIAEPMIVLSGYNRFDAIGGRTPAPDWRISP